MKRYALLCMYDGSKFYGWQIQPQSPTVQECLEYSLSRIAKTSIKVIGSGRTDSGVHALAQVAHFDFPLNMSIQQLLLAISTFLPPYIKVLEIVEVPPDFHARYDALSRSYTYILTKDRTPFNYHYKTYYPQYKKNLDKFRECIPYFLGEHDFTSFAKPNPEITNHVCDIKSLEIKVFENDIIISITANRFLHNMVRRIVGALISVSHKSHDPKIVQDWLEMKKHEQKNYFTALPNGLYLTKVEYPVKIF